MQNDQTRESARRAVMVRTLVAISFAGLLTALAFGRAGTGGLSWMPRSGEPNTAHQAHLDLERGNDAAALSLLQTLVKRRDPAAQYWLAHMSELGLGTSRDIHKAIELYKAAADGNVPAAQLRLGEIYLHGNLVPPDIKLAKTYLEQAAYQGEPRAALLLAQMYRTGLGAPPDLVKAYAWAEVSTIEGNVSARRERDASLLSLDAQDQTSAVARAQTILADIRQETAALHSSARGQGQGAPAMRKAPAPPNA